MAKKQAKKVRGIYEKVPGSGVWWVRYSDATGRIRREKAGLKQTAETLYRKRKTEVLQGKKLPESRKRAVSFEELTKDALDYSKAHTSAVTRMTSGDLRNCASTSGTGPPMASRLRILSGIWRLKSSMINGHRPRQTAVGPCCRWPFGSETGTAR